MASYSEQRGNYIVLAKHAKEEERYEEMFESMKKVARLNAELTLEERALLDMSMKEVIRDRRSSIEMLSPPPPTTTIIEASSTESDCREDMESGQLSKICYDMISLIDDHLLPSSSNNESIAFYHRLKGDCYRYMAEFKTGTERTMAIDMALEAYEKGSDIAEVELTHENHVRLGLALNLSVLYYDILKLPVMAIAHARLAMDEADEDLGSLSMEAYDESFKVMSVLRSNIFLWDSMNQRG